MLVENLARILRFLVLGYDQCKYSNFNFYLKHQGLIQQGLYKPLVLQVKFGDISRMGKGKVSVFLINNHCQRSGRYIVRCIVCSLLVAATNIFAALACKSVPKSSV